MSPPEPKPPAALVQALPSSLKALQAAPAEDVLSEAMRAVLTALQLRHFALVHHGPTTPSVPRVQLTDYPPAWVSRYRAKGYRTDDPVMAACRKVVRGFLWSELPSLMPLTDKQAAILAEARAFGLGEGFTVPIHVPGERSGSCSFVVGPGEGIASEVRTVLPYVAGLAFEKARLLLEADTPSPPASLTDRQLDCLVLVARGKSDWEAATILGLSRETVHQHIEAAKQRFGAKTRLQLAVKALAQGALSFSDVLPWAFPAKKG